MSRQMTDIAYRDWIAGKALSGLCSISDLNCTNEKMAIMVFNLADAMVKERGKRTWAHLPKENAIPWTTPKQ